jgi:3-methyladenine DNA glycosylase AlkD
MLKEKADSTQLEGMSRYGMSTDQRLGVKVPEMRKLAKQLGKDQALSLALWETGIDEARIMAALVGDPGQVTEAQMDAWVADLNSWDVCDQVCMNLFDKTPLAWKKVREWAEREEEFVKRAAYALIACLAWHDKKASDQQFIDLIPVVKAGVFDERNYVKKAVSWALRHIGKRNPALNQVALGVASELQVMEAKNPRWIAAQAFKDLTSESTKRKMAKMGA